MTLACTRHYIWTNLWKITFSSRTHRKYSTMKVNFRFECTDNLLRRLIEQSCNGYKTHLWWKSSSITKTSTLLKFRFYIRRRQRWINIRQTRHDQLKGGWKDAKNFFVNQAFDWSNVKLTESMQSFSLVTKQRAVQVLFAP